MASMIMPMLGGSRWDRIQLDSIWSQLEEQINPFTSVISIPGGVFNALDHGGKQYIAQRFMAHVLEQVMFCRDGTSKDSRWFLGAPRNFVNNGGMVLLLNNDEPCWTVPSDFRVQTATIRPPLVVEKPVKIPRPPNAYILYRKERHNLVKDQYPGITNNEISQILGKAWNLEAREVRLQYKEKAEAIKKALFEKHPDYQYKPRKPSEKRRRQRRATTNLNQAGDVGNVDDDNTPESLEDDGTYTQDE